MGSRILLLDRDPSSVDHMRTLLAQAGFDVTVASQPDDAVDAARARPFDLMFVEDALAVDPGSQICRTLQEAAVQEQAELLLLTAGEAAVPQGSRLVRKSIPVAQLLDLCERLLFDREQAGLEALSDALEAAAARAAAQDGESAQELREIAGDLDASARSSVLGDRDPSADIDDELDSLFSSGPQAQIAAAPPTAPHPAVEGGAEPAVAGSPGLVGIDEELVVWSESAPAAEGLSEPAAAVEAVPAIAPAAPRPSAWAAAAACAVGLLLAAGFVWLAYRPPVVTSVQRPPAPASPPLGVSPQRAASMPALAAAEGPRVEVSWSVAGLVADGPPALDQFPSAARAAFGLPFAPGVTAVAPFEPADEATAPAVGPEIDPEQAPAETFEELEPALEPVDAPLEDEADATTGAEAVIEVPDAESFEEESSPVVDVVEPSRRPAAPVPEPDPAIGVAAEEPSATAAVIEERAVPAPTPAPPTRSTASAAEVNAPAAETRPPEPIERAWPRVPPGALRPGSAGSIVLRVLVGASGSISRVLVQQGVEDPDIEAAAITAALRWKFRPALERGVPVEAWTTVEFDLAR